MKILGKIAPKHFLLENRSSTMLSLLAEADFDHRRRYVQAQCYNDSIWKSWIGEHKPKVPKPYGRSKRPSPAKSELKSGDLVWVADELTPRVHFPMGRIETSIMAEMALLLRLI